MKQHAGLTVERWSKFTLEQQILSIAAEMLRARASLELGAETSVRLGYERVLRMVDLTVAANRSPRLWRELLRWRDLVAEQYISPQPSLELHMDLLRCLLRFTKETSKQVAHL